MRPWFLAHPGLGSSILGAAFALLLFAGPGHADVAPVNLVLAILLGVVFAAAMYGSQTRRPPH